MIVRFYKTQEAKCPWDAYGQHDGDLVSLPSTIAFAIYNWLQMHPLGRVEFVTDKGNDKAPKKHTRKDKVPL